MGSREYGLDATTVDELSQELVDVRANADREKDAATPAEEPAATPAEEPAAEAAPAETTTEDKD